MSVIWIKRKPENAGSFGKVTDSRTRRGWIVRTDGLTDTEFTVRNHGQSQGIFPTPYVDSLDEAPDMVCKTLDVERDRNNPRFWDVTATFSTVPTSELDLQAQEAPNPMSRQAEVSLSTVQYQEAGIEDLDGKAFCNSAGDPFDPPVEYQRSRWVVHVKKNMTTIPSWLPDYENAVNNDTFNVQGLVFAAYTLRLSGISISETKREKVPSGVEYFFRTVSFKLEHNRDKWHPLKVLDQGLRYKYGIFRVPIKEQNLSSGVDIGRPITTPVLLDGNGQRLSDPSPQNAVFLDFKVYPLKPFTGYVPTI